MHVESVGSAASFIGQKILSEKISALLSTVDEYPFSIQRNYQSLLTLNLNPT